MNRWVLGGFRPLVGMLVLVAMGCAATPSISPDGGVNDPSDGGMDEMDASDADGDTAVVNDGEGLSVGAFHACHLAAGAVTCWGENAEGQLGNGSKDNKPLPTPIAPASGSAASAYKAVSAGGAHTCALTVAGMVVCWGNNIAGQLGTNASTGSSVPVSVDAAGPATTYASIAAGDNHTCALTTTGTVHCWGQILGNARVPTQIPTPEGSIASPKFVAVTSGVSHSCGLAEGGAAYCWGNNGSGQVGDGQTGVSAPAPKRVQSSVDGGTLSLASLSAGDAHSCGLTTEGTSLCWGGHANGALGDGVTNTTTAPLPQAVLGPGGGAALTFTTLVAGHQNTCGLMSDGKAYCWGSNDHAQTGTGDNGAAVGFPTAVAPQAGGAALEFAVLGSGLFFACGLTNDGSVYCWGDNASGQLGVGSTSTTPSKVPVRVGPP